MILHTQDRPFKCSFCDEYFKSRFARLKHQEKFHLGEKCPVNINSSAYQFKNKPLLFLTEKYINIILTIQKIKYVVFLHLYNLYWMEKLLKP